MGNRGIWIGLAILALAALGATAGTARDRAEGADPGSVDLSAQVTALAGLHGAEYTAARNALVDQGQAALPALEPLAGSGDALTASAALACAGWIEHGEDYEMFLGVPARVTAAGTLRFTGVEFDGDPKWSPLMVEVLLFSGADAAHRGAAVDLLQRLRDPRSVPALDHALRHDEAVDVRSMVAQALGRLDEESVVARLDTALVDETEPMVRAAILGGLSWHKDPAAAPALRTALANEADPTCRARAAQGLGWLRDPAHTAALVATLDGDGSAEVRQQAALALGKVGGEEARAALQRAVTNDVDPEVNRLAGVALERME